MYKKIISLIAVSALFFGATVMAHTIAKKGMKADLVLMPKFLGILYLTRPTLVRRKHTGNWAIQENWNSLAQLRKTALPVRLKF